MSGGAIASLVLTSLPGVNGHVLWVQRVHVSNLGPFVSMTDTLRQDHSSLSLNLMYVKNVFFSTDRLALDLDRLYSKKTKENV